MESLIFEFNHDSPIYLQIYQTLVNHMLDGYIKQGEKLPSVRVLAKQLGVSKSTIENAYDRLLSEGFIVAKAKSGYFCDIPEMKKKKTEILPMKNEINSHHYLYDFSSRLTDYEQFDQKVWIRYTKEILENGTLMAGYGHPQGEYELRDELSSYLYHSRNLKTHPEHLLIGAGISPLLYFICSLFKQKTLKVGFLKPGFIQAMRIFEDCHHEIILLDHLEDVISSSIDILYLTPTTLNLSVRKRMELLKTLKARNIYLIEDDLNGEMFYRTTPISCMQSLLDEDYVFYISSFSKLLLPSLRLAVLSIPSTFKYSLQYYNQTASRIEQQVLAMYLHDGHMHRRVKRLKRQYLKKTQLMEEILNKYFFDIKLVEPSLYFEIKDDFTNLKQDHLINFQKIDDYTIHLYFSGMNEEQIEKGLYYLIQKWKLH